MPQESTAAADRVCADFTIAGGNFRLTFRATVPAGPVRVSELLPVARALSDTIVGETCRAAEEAGKPVSCTSGCAACCRNLVAISQVEARRIAGVLAALPEPRRSSVEARFAQARERLAQAGLLERLRDADRWTPDEYAAGVGAYFALGIPCPFLEQDSCSIYEERPIACREYLVTSPPAHCARLGSEGVELVPLPLHLFNAVARWQVAPQGHFLERWLPLTLAPEWAAAHPDEPPPRPGLELLQELLSRVNA